MRRAVLICVALAVLSPRYAEAVERIWRVGVLTPVDDGIVRSVMLPYLATRGFVEAAIWWLISELGGRSNCRSWQKRWLATNPMQ
jgi:hypothetical protein